jgi:predicted transcriptional regulator of viral defense system
MSREKWMLIIRKANEQGGQFKKAEVTAWFAPLYYAGEAHYAQEILARMVKDGCINRIKKGHYQVMRGPKPMNGGVKAKQIFTNPEQGELF